MPFQCLSEGHTPWFCREVPASLIFPWELSKSQFLLDKSLVSVGSYWCNRHWYFLPSLLVWFIDKFSHPGILGTYVRFLCSCSLQLLLNMETVCASALGHQQFQSQPSSRGKWRLKLICCVCDSKQEVSVTQSGRFGWDCLL